MFSGICNVPLRSPFRTRGLAPPVPGSAAQTALSCQLSLGTEEKATACRSPQPVTSQHEGSKVQPLTLNLTHR